MANALTAKNHVITAVSELYPTVSVAMVEVLGSTKRKGSPGLTSLYMQIDITEFQLKVLELLRHIEQLGNPVTITRAGEPIIEVRLHSDATPDIAINDSQT